jgi:hypothetical protein
MARKGRIEFPGAVYHVLDRGDRREPIVRTDNDRAAFVRTLGQTCDRAGYEGGSVLRIDTGGVVRLARGCAPPDSDQSFFTEQSRDFPED